MAGPTNKHNRETGALPPLEATMEAFRRQVSGTGAKKKKPEPVTRDAYGFVVRNPNP